MLFLDARTLGDLVHRPEYLEVLIRFILQEGISSR